MIRYSRRADTNRDHAPARRTCQIAAQRPASSYEAVHGKPGTDLNRDRLAAALADRGVQPVRQVSIDDTWSALRFRPASG